MVHLIAGVAVVLCAFFTGAAIYLMKSRSS